MTLKVTVFADKSVKVLIKNGNKDSPYQRLLTDVRNAEVKEDEH